MLEPPRKLEVVVGAQQALVGCALGHQAMRFALDAEVAGRSVRYEFEGRVEGDAIAGKVKASDGTMRDWRARRLERAAINITPTPADPE